MGFLSWTDVLPMLAAIMLVFAAVSHADRR